jgi:hypothetical protein
MKLGTTQLAPNVWHGWEGRHFGVGFERQFSTISFFMCDLVEERGFWGRHGQEGGHFGGV